MALGRIAIFGRGWASNCAARLAAVAAGCDRRGRLRFCGSAD